MRTIRVRRSTRGICRKLLLLIAVIAAALTLGCGLAATTTAAVVAGPAADQSAVNGTYRVAISDADLKTHGVTSPGDIHENHGLFTGAGRHTKKHRVSRTRTLRAPAR